MTSNQSVRSNARNTRRNMRSRRAKYGIRLTFYPEGQRSEVTVELPRSRRSLSYDLSRALLELKNSIPSTSNGVIRCCLYRPTTMVHLVADQATYSSKDDINLLAHEFHETLKSSLSSVWTKDY